MLLARSTARSESTSRRPPKRSHARLIVAPVRKGLVGRRMLKHVVMPPGLDAQATKAVPHPLDVGRQVAGQLGRPEERDLGAVVPGDGGESAESVETMTASNTPLSSAAAIV